VEDFALLVAGAVIGALASGGVKALVEYTDRKRSRKVAARAILGDLVLVEGLVQGVREHGDWPVVFDSERPLAAWSEFRGAFAASVSGAEWAEVDAAFRVLHQVGLAASLGQESVEPAGPLLEELLVRVRLAKKIAVEHAARSEEARAEIERVIDTAEPRSSH